MQTRFISIIVPNYNHAPYLKQRLDSIFLQTYQNFEVIILDDYSLDESRSIIETYRENPKVSHIIYNDCNSGSPFKQWAKGFSLAKGEFIWIAESDDWAEPRFLEKLVEGLSASPEIVVAFSAKVLFHPNKSKIKCSYETNKVLEGNQFIHDKMIDDNSIYNASCAIFKKSTLSKISNDYKNFRGCGDWLFWVELCRHGNIFYCAEPLSYFRQHESNTTAENMSSGRDLIEYWNIFQKLKKWGHVTPFLKMIVALRYFDYAKQGQKKNSNNKNFSEAISLWKKEIPCRPFSRIIIPLGIALWNLRLKIFHLFHK